MYGTEELIKEVMANLRLSNFEYSDEPLLFPASKMKQFTPKKYAEMRKIGENERPSANRAAKVFLAQARFMSDFEDDYNFEGEITAFHPTYSDMTVSQLRGYFSWRTRLRHGEIQAAPLPFTFLYAFELLNGIGASSPDESFEKLYDFTEKYSELDNRVVPYFSRWMHDCIILNGLDSSLLDEEFVFPENNEQSLRDVGFDEPEVLFLTVSQNSSYRIEQSALYKKYPEDTRQALAFVLRELSMYRDYDEYETALDALCGKKRIENYYMFPGIYYCTESLHEDCVYTANSSSRYICKNGFWMHEYTLITPSIQKRITAFLKNFASEMLKRKGLKALKTLPLERRLNELIIKGIDKYDAFKLEQSRPKINIDISKLDSIRMAAETTCEKLITEADINGGEIEAEVRETIPVTAEKNASPENELIKRLISGKDYKGFLHENGYMLSVLVDSINEKYFDVFGDTVIDFDGEAPFIIEDYLQDLKEAVENESA